MLVLNALSIPFAEALVQSCESASLQSLSAALGLVNGCEPVQTVHCFHQTSLKSFLLFYLLTLSLASMIFSKAEAVCEPEALGLAGYRLYNL